MTDTLTALDATFLELEQLDEGALMSIGGVSVFDPVPGGGAPSIEGGVREPRGSARSAPALFAATFVGGRPTSTHIAWTGRGRCGRWR